MIKEKLDIVKKSIDRGNTFHNNVYPYFHEFINFLNVEKILYFLCGGTLLGCIRNNKKILWDDDYDIYIKTSEFKRLKQYSRNKTNIIKNDKNNKKNIIYYLKLKNYSYLITKTKSNFYQVWGYEDGVGIINKTTDIFSDADCWYRTKSSFFSSVPISRKFHDLSCNISKNFDKELKYFYGKNYMDEYVVSNHLMGSYYKDSDKKNRIILTREQYNEIITNISTPE